MSIKIIKEVEDGVETYDVIDGDTFLDFKDSLEEAISLACEYAEAYRLSIINLDVESFKS